MWVRRVGFKVLRTENQADTKRLYVRIARHLTNLYNSLSMDSVYGRGQLLRYSEWRDRCLANKKVTCRDLWAKMLCSIQGTTPFVPHIVVFYDLTARVSLVMV
jgi:hypothetical protein